MLIRNLSLFCCALFGALAMAAPVEILTAACAECHGPNGVAVAERAPHLNSQLAAYLEEEISGLAQQSRVTGVANHVPKSWTGPDIAAVAKFYASSKAARPPQPVDAQLVVKGELTYQKRCAECHPDNGRNSDHDAPLVAAQKLDYLMEQTRAFVSGKRKFVFMMDDAFRGLSPAELDSVAHFFAGQSQFRQK